MNKTLLTTLGLLGVLLSAVFIGPQQSPAPAIAKPVTATVAGDQAVSHPVAQAEPVITITGCVNHPLQLSLSDLQRLESTELKMNEVSGDGAFHGVFHYRAVPLQTLLNMAGLNQKDSTFKKLVDATIVVTDSQGKKAVLSWGEIYYSNPAQVTLAYQVTPIYPVKHNCQKCHEPEEYQFALEQLGREVALPKLLVMGDFYSDRLLEGIVNIEVVDVRPQIAVDRQAALRSERITISGDLSKPLTLNDLSGYPAITIDKKIVGVGRGYHGLHSFGGTSLTNALTAAGITPKIDQVVIAWAPDGYRSTFSMGELFLSETGHTIILADTKDNAPFDQGGKMRIIVGPDHTDDRDVQAVTNIEAITLQ